MAKYIAVRRYSPRMPGGGLRSWGSRDSRKAPIRVHVQGLKELREYFAQVGRAVPIAGSAMTKVVAERIARMVRDTYRSIDAPRTEGTLQTYRYGSTRGGHRRFASTSPMSRSGQLIRSVKVEQLTSSRNRTHWRVAIDPNAAYSSGADPKDAGKRIIDIAAQLEAPVPYAFKLTAKMLRYLKWLDEKDGIDRPQVANIGDTIVVYPRPRPVWKTVIKELRKNHAGMPAEFLRQLKLHTKGKKSIGASFGITLTEK